MTIRNVPGSPAPLPDVETALTRVLGYLNYSNGKPDAAFLTQFNQLSVHAGVADSWAPLQTLLLERLAALMETSPTFKDAAQAQAVIPLVIEKLLPAYQAWHSDLLFHLLPQDWINPFFLGRCFEAALQQGGPWSEEERVISGAIERLNDFLGYRPLAVLENGRKMTPYEHERFRPLPLYIAGAGACAGPAQAIVEQAIELLRQASPDVLTGAYFHLDHLDELAVDLRAYDHDHPAFKRTNYLFGEWDPHCIDNSGHYRRFVVRKIIMDALVEWVAQQSDQTEAVFDAGAVLSGTILMASAISGDGPTCHDSTVSLTSLLPRVARQRDDFYVRLMGTLAGARKRRIEREAKLAQQPFGHVRQALNLRLAHYGARQVQYRHLAILYARLGHADAAREQAAVIPCASTRFECEVQWRLTSASQQFERGEVEQAAGLLVEIEDLLMRAIHCGAFVDPWNILGFQGNFPLFNAREDAIPDQRVELMLDLMERIFGVFSQGLTEAAAQGHREVGKALTARFEKLAAFWDQFAAHVIEDLPRVSGGESFESARHVAAALAEWRAAGQAAGDISFWRRHVEQFTSAKSYACVVEALLARGDFVASMALLVQWLSRADEVGVESGPWSIHALLIDWMNRLAGEGRKPDEALDWSAMRRLFDFIEANAGDYWDVPQLDFVTRSRPKRQGDSPDDWDVERDENWLEEEEDEDNLFGAAYDGIVYKDSTDDGNEGEVLDTGTAPGNTEFENINRQLEPRIKFVMALAQLWQIASTAIAAEYLSREFGDASRLASDQRDVIEGWWERARQLQVDLLSLMQSVWDLAVDETGGDHDANVEYDIQLQTKFYLLNTIIATHINCRVAEVGLMCLMPPDKLQSLPEEDSQMVAFYRAAIRQDVEAVRNLLGSQFRRLSRKPLLYVPLDAGGHPMQILASRTIQTDIRFMLRQLPRLGLFRETWHVVRLAHRMERETRPSQMSVTEFDRIFRTALRNTMDCLIESASAWDDDSDDALVSLGSDILHQYSEQWIRHARTMRLSTVEGLRNEAVWDEVSNFIVQYGAELFHARSLTLGNVRTILHNGIEWFLEQLAQMDDPLHPSALIEALNSQKTSVDDVVEYLELIYGSVVDKFDRFLEYNSTTTQSDYGEKFSVLLDFLRVEAAYDRDAWELIPEGIVHKSLAMAGRHSALRLLEDNLETETRDTAERHVQELAALEQKYGVHLPAVADRLNERFVKPLAINRILALIELSRRTARSGPEVDEHFQHFREEVEQYMQNQAGSAVDIPQWLQDIEREVNRLETPSDYIRPPELEVRLAALKVSPEEVRQQLEIWGQSVTDSETGSKKKTTRRRRRKDSEG